MRKFLFGLLVLGLVVGFAAPSVAQDEKEPPVKLQATVGLGGGSFFGEEDVTFSSDALYADLHWYAVSLPVEGGSSGVGLEVHFGDAVSYSLWNLNRADVPGLTGKVYAVADMKFGQGGGAVATEVAPADSRNVQAEDEPVEAGYRADFDVRVGLGAYLGKVGKGNFVLEFYTLEENRPVAFSLMYRF